MRRAVSSATSSTSARARAAASGSRSFHAFHSADPVAACASRTSAMAIGAPARAQTSMCVKGVLMRPTSPEREGRADVGAQGFVEPLAAGDLHAPRLDEEVGELDRRAWLAVERPAADPPAPHRGNLLALGQMEQRGHAQLGAHPLRAPDRPGDEPLDGLTLRRGQPRRVPLDEVRERPVVRRVAGLECLDRDVVDPLLARRERGSVPAGSAMVHRIPAVS